MLRKYFIETGLHNLAMRGLEVGDEKVNMPGRMGTKVSGENGGNLF